MAVLSTAAPASDIPVSRDRSRMDAASYPFFAEHFRGVREDGRHALAVFCFALCYWAMFGGGVAELRAGVERLAMKLQEFERTLGIRRCD